MSRLGSQCMIAVDRCNLGGQTVAEPTGRQVVERLARAIEDKDFETIAALITDDYVEELPQSGERVRGKQNQLAIVRNYPGGVGTAETRRIVGEDGRWVMAPSFNLLRIEGSGDTFTYVANIRYPNGETWQVVAIMEVRDGKVAKATTWYAAPFEAPKWRAPYVERFEPMTG